MARRPVITIDGPAGAGKSTAARLLAARLGYTLVPTGAMYRALALGVMRAGIAPREGPELRAHLAPRAVAVANGRVSLDGEDVTDAIRTPQVSEDASRVASDPEVRSALVAEQQRLLASGNWVAEGRDIALVVAPEAEVKVFLTATPEERAKRRADQVGGDVATVLKEQAMRDERDNTPGRSTLEPAADAVPVDTTGLTLDEVVGQIATLAVEAREIGA
jgi:CMP/dCMP kinase